MANTKSRFGLASEVDDASNLVKTKFAPAIKSAIAPFESGALMLSKAFAGKNGVATQGGGLVGNRVSAEPIFTHTDGSKGPQAIAGPASGTPPNGPTNNGPLAISGPQNTPENNNRIAPSGAAMAATAASVYGLAASALSGANEYVKQDYLTSRQAAFGYGGSSGSLQDKYKNLQEMQAKYNKMGVPLSKTDFTEAISAAGAQGLAGKNLGAAMQSAGTMSAITPGLGAAGAVNAFSAVQTGRSINNLITAGIQIRDSQGRMKSIPQIIDLVWAKMQREKAPGSEITVSSLNNELAHGMPLAMFLDFYFGGDPGLRASVENGLMVIASNKGAKLETISKDTLQKQGFLTSPVTSGAKRTAKAALGLSLTSPQAVKGVTFSNDVASSLSDLTNAIYPVVGAFAELNLAMKGLGGIAGFGNLIKGFPLIGGLFKAEGGPVAGRSPYIVGEKGPELFVPKTDGTIVPNHKLNDPFRADGVGDLTAGGMKINNPTEFAKAFLRKIGAPQNPDSINAIKTWERFEGGHFGNSAHYNPLNTSLKLEGSRGMSTKNQLVQAYTSWEQGLDATVATLTGKNAKNRGYTDIINALKSGKSRDEILKAINASAWVHGQGKSSNYKFGGSTSDYEVSGMYKGTSGGATSGTQVSSSPKLADNYIKTTGPVAGDFTGSGSGSGSTSNTFGPVSITVNGKANAKEIATAVATALTKASTTKIGQK